MQVKIKRVHKDAVIPKYAKPGDAGMDLTAVSVEWDKDNLVWSYDTGICFEIPKGYVGLLFPRSSIYKQDLSLSNAVGVLDSGYRGSVSFKFKETVEDSKLYYHKGERIGQIVILPYPEIEFEEVEELSETERGTGGYGSSGK